MGFLPHEHRKDSWPISSLLCIGVVASEPSERSIGFLRHREQWRIFRSGREFSPPARSDFLAASRPWPACIAPRSDGLLVAFDQPSLAPVLFAGALFGLAAHQATQSAQRHRMRILPFLLSHHSAPSPHLCPQVTPPLILHYKDKLFASLCQLMVTYLLRRISNDLRRRVSHFRLGT